MRTLVIAEAGVNHNANLDLAFALIDAAVSAGADIVKFQTAVPEEVVTGLAPQAFYQRQNIGYEETQLEMTRRIHLPLDSYVALDKYARKKNIQFLSTSFGETATTFLMKLNMKRWKIPSGEITNVPYLRQIAKIGRPVILSTGMSDLDEVSFAIEILIKGGIPKHQLTLLHCTSEYPTAPEDVNLKAMETMQKYFRIPVGLSDHTKGIEVSLAAVALGASIIEKHFTLDKAMDGPDHAASIDPLELRTMVESIRDIELALGDGKKRPRPCEYDTLKIVRRSIVAKRAINKGELFNDENITTKRPAYGIPASQWDTVLGRRAKRKFAVDELIEI